MMPRRSSAERGRAAGSTNPKGTQTVYTLTLKRNGIPLVLALILAAGCTGHPSTPPSVSATPPSSTTSPARPPEPISAPVLAGTEVLYGIGVSTDPYGSSEPGWRRESWRDVTLTESLWSGPTPSRGQPSLDR